jgi:CRP-like cAMP-binding protein
MSMRTPTPVRSREEAESVLQGVKLFAGLDKAALRAVAEAASWRGWTAGATIFQRGDEGNHLIVVASGRLRLSLGTAQGKEILIGTVGPGGIVGEVAIIDGQPRSADATAVEDTVGLLLWRDAFLRLIARQPELGLSVARYLCSLLRSTNFQMESIALHELRARLVRFLLMSVRQVHGADPPRMAKLKVGLNQSELSAMLGASRPKLNRALHELIDEGVLVRDGEVLVCDMTLLREIAEEAGASDI